VTAFARALEEHALRGTGPRRWLFVPYDQLTAELGPLSREPPSELGIVLVECPHKAERRPYHKQKLALVLANLRHFAIEQAARGVAVRHVVAAADYASALLPLVAELGPLRMMEPAERELRAELAPLVGSGALEVVPHEGWLTTDADFAAAAAKGAKGGEPPWRMDRFYAAVRRRTGTLMDGDKPRGGRMSHDAENRKPYRGSPPAPVPPRFTPDAITREVGALVESHFSAHPGRLDLATLPATAADARATWEWAERACLPTFGPYEDAMTTQSSGLFHTRIAPLLNLHRLLPRDVVARTLALPLPLASQEGFVRQILGWREFVRHVHRATDGFRRIPGRAPTPDADPSVLGANRPLPAAYWGKPSGLACLDQVVGDVWREGYSHHITRLMILSNIAMLLDVSPRALTDWFWAAYIDAYDWVVEPNVLGMGTYATGDLMVTKPYIAGAGYVNRMSDYCGGCAFDPESTCPLTPMYWAFLARHEEALAKNPRMIVPISALRKRAASKRAHDAEVFARVSASLADSELLAPNAGSD
jgi:deoxyribodipyrimidine photolyase-related protein